jgi:hypothetical protein
MGHVVTRKLHVDHGADALNDLAQSLSVRHFLDP